MPVVLFGIIALLFTGMIGAVIGWFLHHYLSAVQLEVELATSKSPRVQEKPSSQNIKNDRTAELMAKLAELTSGVASEVGKHTGNIEAINAELAAINGGDAGAVVAVVTKILQANQQMQQELHSAETRLQEQQQELVAQTTAARTDQLTKIFNRRALDEELKKCVQDFQRSAQPFSVMVLDVDHFKKFNDTHGHLAGDEVLRSVAQAVASQALDSDFVARYGGEEFVVVFRGESVAACGERGDRLRASIHELAINFDGKELRVAASAGLAEIEIGEDEKGLIRRADEALYVSKKAGRNCAHWNDGRKNLPIVPATLSQSKSPLAGPVPPRPDVSAKPRRFDLHDIRFSDASFTPNLDRRVAEWKRTGYSFSTAICAIDEFEKLRMKHGDQLLQKIVNATASVVGSCLRDTDQMAAFGGNGFAVSLPSAQIRDAAIVAERIRKAVEKIDGSTSGLPRFTISVGVAQIIEGNDASRLFDRAQRALDAAQEGTANRTFLHDGLYLVPAVVEQEAVPA
jgi:diguanylate cyclase